MKKPLPPHVQVERTRQAERKGLAAAAAEQIENKFLPHLPPSSPAPIKKSKG